jgi:integrase/recombinase XerD
LNRITTSHGILENQRIFKLSYAGARAIAIRAGKVAGIHLRPHDLSRFPATPASRSRPPIEIVSKVILRPTNLSTTERCLGPVSDTEAVPWIESIHG